MATDATNAAAIVSQYWSRLAELDSVPSTMRAQMSYTDENGRSVGWNEYRAAIADTLKKIIDGGPNNSSPQQIAGGPFTIYG